MFFLIIALVSINIWPLFNAGAIIFESKKKLIDTTKKELFSTDRLEAYTNYLAYKVFKISLVNQNVIPGKDNFLFLGNSFDNVLDKTTGKFRPDKSEIHLWTEKLKKLQDWYEDKDIKFTFVIAPNKHSIYKDKLPDWLSYYGKTITDDIVNVSLQKDINIVDLRPALLKYSNDENPIYWKTDTHWNQKGGAIAFEEVISFIKKKHGLHIDKPEYFLKASQKKAGDLCILMKIQDILPDDYENEYKYIFKKKYDICRGNINKDNGNLEKCIKTVNFLTDVARPQFVTNKNIKKNKLLFICDSFGVSPSNLYNTSFSTVWQWHYSHINKQKLSEFVKKNKPDLVIYQIVERHFYDRGDIYFLQN
jgi:hypothetical protein